MDDLDLIIEQVEVMVNSIQKGVENVLRKQCRLKTPTSFPGLFLFELPWERGCKNTSALVMLENLLGVFLICSTLFRSK